ncbi:MAG: oligosaccharide flippase family protein [Planctomycetota bacterium]
MAFLNRITRSLRGRTLQGLAWQAIGRGGERLLRFAVNVALARVLLPEDFGLAGLVTAALATADAVTFLAGEQVLVQSARGRDPDFHNTLFWASAARGGLLAAVLAALAPLFAGYFNRPEARGLFLAIALQPLVAGLASPRAMVLVKDMRFRRWCLYRLAATAVGVGLTVALGVLLRNAWALVAGQILTVAALTAGSHAMAPFRPALRFDLASWREMRAYWMRAAGTPVLLALVAQAPAILLGKLGGAAALGVFLQNQRLGSVPSDLSLQAAGTVAMPAYSALQDDRPRLCRLWLKALWAIALLALPLAATLAWLDADLPAAVFGQGFAGERGLFALLAAGGALRSLLAVTGPLFWGTGLPSYDRQAQLIRTVLVYGAGIWWTLSFGGIGLASALLAGLFVSLVSSLRLARRIVEVRWRAIGLALLPGLGAAGATVLLLAGLDALRVFSGGWRIGALGAAGALVCTAAALWIRHRDRQENLRRPTTPVAGGSNGHG